MISAHTTPADLVARILQPLARSLEEARQHLALEDVDDTQGEDDQPAPAAEGNAPVVRLAPHAQPMPSRHAHAVPTADIDPPPRGSTPTVAPIAPEVTSGIASTSAQPSPASAPLPQTPAAGGTRPQSSVLLRMQDTHPDATPVFAPTTGSTSPTMPHGQPRAAIPAPQVPAPDKAATNSLHQPDAPTRQTTAPTPAAIRLIRPNAATDLAPLPDADAPSPIPAEPPRHATATTPADALPTSTPGAPPQPAPTPSANAEPPLTPPARHWRLRAAPANETAPLAEPEPDAAAPSLTVSRGTAAPSVLPRNPALTRVMQAMDPVLDKAWQLTDAALPTGRDAPSDMAAEAPRVTNQFNVTVALGEAADTAGRDPRQLEDALVALLRDAARRQGLDV